MHPHIPAAISWRLAITVVLLAASTYCAAAEIPLTLAEAQRLAVQRSRQLNGIESSATASREMAAASGQRPDPVLKFGIDNVPVDGPDKGSLSRDFMTMRRIGLSQELTRSDKRHWRAQGYALTADKADAEKAAATAAIQRDTAIAWIERYYTEQMSTLAAELEAQTRTEIEAAQASYRAGRGSQADVLAARTTLAMAADRSSETIRRARIAATDLARWVGADAGRPLTGQPPVDTIALDPSRLDTQIVHHPQLAVLARDVDIAQAAVKLAEAEKKSDWSVELAFQQRGSGYSNMVSVGLSVPLQWNSKNKQDRELGARLATVGQVRAEREEAERGYLAEVRGMLFDWESGRERIARYERQLLPLARDRTQAELAAYKGGKASLSDVLQGRRDETELRLQELQLRMDTARVWARLNYLFPADAQNTTMDNK